MKTHLFWIAAAVVALGFGFLAGRQFPAHHYQKYGETRFLLDTSTGALCDPVPPPKSPTADQIDQLLTTTVPVCHLN